MRKLRTVVTLSAIMTSVMLAMPQSVLSVSAEEKKPIGAMVCDCGYTMNIYTYGMSDDEAATWDNHMYQHMLKGEDSSYTDITYDYPSDSNSGQTSNGTSSNKGQTSNGTSSSNGSSSNKGQTSNGTSSNKGQTSNGSSSNKGHTSNGTSSNKGQTGNTTNSAYGVLKGTGNTKDNAAYGKRQIKARPTDYKTVMLSWDAVPGAKSYEIYYSTSPNGGFKRLATAKKTSYKFSKAECGKTYYFQMRVCKKLTKSNFGPVSYAKTSLTGTPGLQVKKTTYNSVTLKWGKVSGAKKYKVYYMSSTGNGWQLLATVSGTGYTHKKLVTGATYSYKVRPVRDSQYGNWSGKVSATTPFGNIYGLKVKATGSDRLNLTWKKVNGARQYVILRSESKNGVYKTVGYSGKPSYMDKGLKSRKTYFYKVYAVSGKYRTKETGPVKQTTKAVKK